MGCIIETLARPVKPVPLNLRFKAFLVVGNTVINLFECSFWAFPAVDFDPFSFFQVFVVLKEVGDGFQAQLVQIFRFLPLCVKRAFFVDRHGQYFAVFTGFVGHFQNADGAAGDDDAWEQGDWGDDEDVDWVAVATQSFGT